MCDGTPLNAVEALAMLRDALDFLNGADAASLPAQTQADVLRELEAAEARHTTARARFLAAFTGRGGYEDDGQGSARAWLKWQTRVTSGAAAGAVGWARRLTAHPVIDQALASGELSCSWAKHVCAWTDRLPESAREDADRILAGAAAQGAALRDLAGLAEDMYQRSRPRGSSGDDDGFSDRNLRLGITFGGAGRTEGDLTPGCATALAAVLEALGKKAGPEDTRTAGQRRHDALEEACRRLIAAGMLPGRAGQPTHLNVHMTLGQLRGLPGGTQAERAWVAAQTNTRLGWLTGPEADAAACDATIIPVVTGHLDWAALDRLTTAFLAHHGHQPPGERRERESPAREGPPGEGPGLPSDGTPSAQAAPVQAAPDRAAPDKAACSDPSPDSTSQRCPGPSGSTGAVVGSAYWPLAPASRLRLQRALLALAADALSGPGGLASHLRTNIHTVGYGRDLNLTRRSKPGPEPVRRDAAGHRIDSADRPLAAESLPLDIGSPTEAIPAHLRRLIAIRQPRCAFPGCEQPVSVCEVHHLIPRSAGGPTTLTNLAPLCRFHHLVVIHRWGWALVLHPDGTTTATSPDGTRVLHSHGTPGHGAPGDESPPHPPSRHGPPGSGPPSSGPPGQAA